MTTHGVGWASEEASDDLVVPPLNLVLYIHLRIFAYTSNALIASFEYVELMLLYHCTYDAPEGGVLVLGCTFAPDEVSFADVGYPFVFQT